MQRRLCVNLGEFLLLLKISKMTRGRPRPSSLLKSKSAAALVSQRTAADRRFMIKVLTPTVCNTTRAPTLLPLHLYKKPGLQTHLKKLSQDTGATGKLEKQNWLTHKMSAKVKVNESHLRKLLLCFLLGVHWWLKWNNSALLNILPHTLTDTDVCGRIMKGTNNTIKLQQLFCQNVHHHQCWWDEIQESYPSPGGSQLWGNIKRFPLLLQRLGKLAK